jgi:hypothetical protein
MNNMDIKDDTAMAARLETWCKAIDEMGSRLGSRPAATPFLAGLIHHAGQRPRLPARAQAKTPHQHTEPVSDNPLDLNLREVGVLLRNGRLSAETLTELAAERLGKVHKWTNAVERSISKKPERFGKGAIEGLAAPEASNNAADIAAFIPTLTLGIPGTPVLAILLGVLIIHGINLGPNLVFEEPALFWGLVMSFWVGNIILLFLNIPLIGLWVKVLAIPYRILYPAIIVFVCIGTYSVNANAFDVLILAAFAAIGYMFRTLGYSPAPLILGFVLGPMLEENLRRSLLVSRGDPSVFIDRPISLSILILTLTIIAAPLLMSAWWARKRATASPVKR